MSDKKNQFEDYYGPFTVKLNLNKLKGKSKMLSAAWKQCFMFIYPTHNSVLFHYGVTKVIKIKMNAEECKVEMFDKVKNVKNVIQVVGSFENKGDKKKDKLGKIAELFMSFESKEKQETAFKLFKKALNQDIEEEEDDNESNKEDIPLAIVVDSNKTEFLNI